MLYPDDVNYWKEVAEKHADHVRELQEELIAKTEDLNDASDKIANLEDKVNTMTDGFKHIYEKAGEHF